MSKARELADSADNNLDSISVDASGNVTANRLSTDGSIVTLQKDGTTVGSIGSNSGVRPYFVRNGVDGITFSADGDLLPCTSTGSYNDADTNLGVDSVRWKNLYLSGGVYLGGTGSANYLDDYETGTWTPTANSGLTGAYGGSGTYTKAGRAVYCRGTINLTGITGDISIGGLPFTNTDRAATVTALLVGGVTASQNSFVDSSATTFNIQRTGTYSGSAITIYFACWYFI